MQDGHFRLDDAIAHARALHDRGHVVSSESWNDHDRQRAIAGKVPPARTNGWFDE